MALEQPPLPSRSQTTKRTEMLRTCSLPPSSNRATFPFKPASAMKSHSVLESHGSGGLPSVFRPRPPPIVQALTLHEQPRHSASFPIDKHSNSNQPSSPSPPDWLVSDLQNCKTTDRFFFSDFRCKSLPPFPVPIDLPIDSRCSNDQVCCSEKTEHIGASRRR